MSIADSDERTTAAEDRTGHCLPFRKRSPHDPTR